MDKQGILNNIEYQLFHNDLDKVESMIAGLVFKMEPVGVATNFVRIFYKGKNYTNVYPHSYIPEVQITDIPTDMSLTCHLDNLIQEKEELELDMSIVSSYVRKAMNISDEVRDLYLLLDKSLHKYLGLEPTWLVATVTAEQIALFKNNNGKIFDTIKKKLLTNMLLKRG